MFLFFAWTSRGFQISRHTSAQVARGLKTLGSLLNLSYIKQQRQRQPTTTSFENKRLGLFCGYCFFPVSFIVDRARCKWTGRSTVEKKYSGPALFLTFAVMVVKTLNLGEHVQTKNNHAARAARLFFLPFNQSDHCFLASSLPLPSSSLKFPIACFCTTSFPIYLARYTYVTFFCLVVSPRCIILPFFFFPCSLLLQERETSGPRQSLLICPTTWMRHPWLPRHFHMSTSFLSCNDILRPTTT